MDFLDRLQDKINEIPGLPVPLKQGFLGKEESLVIFPSPGSRATREYMDGTKDWNMNYEIAMKSKLQSKINTVLWNIHNELERIDEITSKNGSFQFEEIMITDKPFISDADEQGWFVFLLAMQAKLTIFKGDE